MTDAEQARKYVDDYAQRHFGVDAQIVQMDDKPTEFFSLDDQVDAYSWVARIKTASDSDKVINVTKKADGWYCFEVTR